MFNRICHYPYLQINTLRSLGQPNHLTAFTWPEITRYEDILIYVWLEIFPNECFQEQEIQQKYSSTSQKNSLSLVLLVPSYT